MTVTLDTAKLDAMIATNPARIAEVVGKTAFRVLAKAQSVTPRDPARPPQDPTRQVSGALRANVDVTKVDEKGLTQDVNYYQEYAIYQELGAPAINLPARPFLTPATEAESEAFIAELAKVVSGE
jgi:hypothetical protein